VEDVVSGCSGGDQATARYEVVRTGRTGHTESIRVVYDPSRIHGTQYRSVIFYADEEQQRIAKEHPQLLAER
jgi:peptide-methionine (S)-S-oxide reductase